MIHLLLAIIYLAFISLGLPDSMLGSAWPSMYTGFGVPVSYAGIISMIISACTILSSLLSDRLTKKLGTGKVTVVSVALTAAALFGFSVSNEFILLCLWAIPYGLGAGSVDAALNNYVALHYASRHMSWLHGLWGVGTVIGPYILGFALSNGYSWRIGYRYVSFFQIALVAVLLVSLPLWKSHRSEKSVNTKSKEMHAKALSLSETLRITGAKEIFIAFFCYGSLEQTTALWASSYMVLHCGIASDTAAAFASLFFIGITVGRIISGFLTFKFSDSQMIRIGQALILSGIILMLLPFGNIFTLAGLILIGFGCAPIYPSIIHSTPEIFGADKSQAIIGVQMASCYFGACIMPPIFGMLTSRISIALLPFFLLAILILMFLMHELLLRRRG